MLDVVRLVGCTVDARRHRADGIAMMSRSAPMSYVSIPPPSPCPSESVNAPWTRAQRHDETLLGARSVCRKDPRR
jgi:hypothetical protein